MNFRLRRLIQSILAASGSALFATTTLAALGVQNPPPGPGMIPDYFGVVPNYANSPQPILATVNITDSGGGKGAVAAATTYDYINLIQTAKVMNVQVLSGGIGYTAATTVTVTGGPNTTPVSLTPIITNGVITGFNEIPSPLPVGWLGLGSGFNTPIANTGIRKFVDSVPLLNTANNLGQQLPVAIPDTATFPGADYYEIAVNTYSQKLHSDLPATNLRGYKQLNAPTGSASASNQYLGPIIVAQKNRPVRIKLVNQLPTGTAGNLPFPVDHTYMGATDTDNRTALHLHGGNTPWISDGTPRQTVKPAGETGTNKGVSASNVPDMWFDASSHALIAACAGQLTCATANATNNPGNGSLTFFYTNQQSQRLMFYHDHAEGITRLNVYDGVAAGYVLQDPTEQAMTNGGAVNGVSYTQTLPTDMIPLVIQEKTFVPDNTKPVLNFFGPFLSQLNSQDPTWRWGSGNAAPGLNGTGDLWVPHVYMTNQNPGDITGANALGRWDYGPWFWPPFTGMQNQPIANPYYDPACVSSTTVSCEGQYIPGVPNGNTLAGNALGQPSGTPEAFNDTPLVNGTAYPYIQVEPKKYRLRMLSVGNDRMLNLAMVVAASKNSVDTTAAGNAGTVNNTILCDGTTAVNPSDCTEVKMVPFNAAQNTAKPFPAWWYTLQKGGVSFDGRPSGVFDPATRGPAMVQIGTEGGFLSQPSVVKNQPINFEYNPKNIVIGNIKEHGLLLGPAERADVVVDFSQFAGSTLILYNDAPAPVPAFDLRLDYFTGDYDNTDTGGAFSTLPGYGPNTRTIMQFQIASTCTSANCGAGINRTPSAGHPVDDVDSAHLTALTSAVQTAFRSSQEPIIVPQAAYNATYGTAVADGMGADISRISDTQLSYTPFADTSTLPATLEATPVTLNMGPKSIIEDFTVDYGRMNALLGMEIPKTTATTQTSIPQAYIDPPTELVKITPNDGSPISGTLADGTQLWKITHNGVDTHAIHFHLFHVQIVNRVGWDGMVRQPDANELGWKDTVRMNPLEDIVVALRPKTMSLPFKVPNSHRVLDPGNTGQAFFYNLDPVTGNASNVTNLSTNFGWEYVWHCHILGHEENDMMRSIAVAQQPEIPSNLSTQTNANGSIALNWTDNSVISNWVSIQRATDSAFSTGLTTFITQVPECSQQTGCARSYTDTTAGPLTYYYRVIANNTVGGGDVNAQLPTVVASLTPGFTGYDNVTASSAASASTSRPAIPIATVTSTPLAFGNQLINTSSAAQTVTLSNTGAGNLLIGSIALTSGSNFILNNGCTTTLAPSASCTISVAFKPSSVGVKTDTLTITDNTYNMTGSIQTVALTGNGVSLAAPTAVSIQRTNTTAATLTWTDASTNETSFQAQTSTNGTTWTNVGAAITRTGAQITGTGSVLTVNIAVNNSTNAQYRVQAINAGGSASSSTVGLNDTLAPVAPVALPATTSIQFLTDTVTLNWTDVANNNASYIAQRCTGTAAVCAASPANAWTNLSTAIAGNAVTFSQIGNQRNRTYTFRVTAINSVNAAAPNYATQSATWTLTTP